MTSTQINDLVKEGKIKQVYRTKNFGGTCFSERLANELAENNVTEFCNFAYTDYGALHGNGILDYAVVRYVEENYKQNNGCAIEPAGWGGKNMILYGNGLKWLREKLSLEEDSDDLGDLLYALEDVIADYEGEAARNEAKEIIKDNPDKELNETALMWAVRDADSGMNTNGLPDYAEKELWERYKDCLAEMQL